MKTKNIESVLFEFTAPDAKEVCIAGSFNGWHPRVAPMISMGNGKWAREVMLAPNRYEYRFVVDGKWVDDPAAKELVPNPFGGTNAVLEVLPGPADKSVMRRDQRSVQRIPDQSKPVRRLPAPPIRTALALRTSEAAIP